ncbi:hypothetical protein CIHG_02234 [Coccidioides immitis H538.4]|uniref:DNA damage-responsive protein 48 n=1 Tax=Coccidioides immitis H538.4 TaxID=396776 RepID=A0A0J8RKH7_COCIT|nr:hypothetical protein CIHG_02234 [Coccidioides immitis H538.4]
MDFVNKLAGQGKSENQRGSSGGEGGMFSGIGDKLNAAAGGGRESEKSEDMLDKGVDFLQERFMGQGKQDNESAVEQAKDEQISDFIRGQYKSVAGSDLPIKDKDTKLG